MHFQAAAALILALVLTIFGAVCSPEVSAHASLVQSDPADKSVVAEAPKQLQLTFHEPVSPLALKLVAADGTATTFDSIAVNGATLSVDAPTDLADGTYILSFRVMSEDDHPVAGSILFSVGARASAAAATPTSVRLQSPNIMATLLLNPGGAGPMTATIEVMDGEANPFEAREVVLSISNKPVGIEPLKRAATRSAEGKWRIDDLIIPLSGLWNVRLDILVTDFEKATLEETVEIK